MKNFSTLLVLFASLKVSMKGEKVVFQKIFCWYVWVGEKIVALCNFSIQHAYLFGFKVSHSHNVNTDAHEHTTLFWG